MNTSVNIPTTSLYLKTIINPWIGPVNVPDLDLTTAFPKGVEITQNINVLGSGSGLVFYNPHNNRCPIRFYVFVIASNQYVFQRFISYDQNLSDDFTLGRFISGGLNLVSATTSGGAFNVSGTFTATAVQEPPDLTTLQYNLISSFKRDNMNVVTSVPVQEGIIALASPDGDHDFRVFQNVNSNTSTTTLKTASFGGVDPGWVAAPVVGIIYDSDNDPGFIPPNLFEEVKVDFIVSLVYVPVAVTGISNLITLTMYGSRVAADWVTVAPVTAAFSFWGSCAPIADAVQIAGEGHWVPDLINNFPALTRVTLTLASTAVSTGYGRAVVSLKANGYYDVGTRGPASLIGFESIAVGQTIALSGVGNFEVVPDSELSKNIPTSRRFGIFHPTEMEMVSKYLSEAQLNGVKMIWNRVKYNQWLNMGGDESHTSLEHIATATGWKEFLSSLWNVSRPLIGTAAPLVGGYLGGPAGAAIGELVGQNLPGISASYSQRAYGQAASYSQIKHAKGTRYTSTLLGTTGYFEDRKILAEKDMFDWFDPEKELGATYNPIDVDPDRLTSLITPTLLASSKNFAQHGQSVQNPLAINLFPILNEETKMVVIGSVIRTYNPIELNGEKLKYSGHGMVGYDDHPMIATTIVAKNQNYELNEAISALCVSVLQAGIFGHLTSKDVVYLTIIAPIRWEQDSFLAACLASFYGVTLANPITGAWLYNNENSEWLSFIPAKLDEKTKSLAAQWSKGLTIVADYPDIRAEAPLGKAAKMIQAGQFYLPNGTLLNPIVITKPLEMLLVAMVIAPANVKTISRTEVQFSEDQLGNVVPSIKTRGENAIKISRKTTMFKDEKTGKLIVDNPNIKRYDMQPESVFKFNVNGKTGDFTLKEIMAFFQNPDLEDETIEKMKDAFAAAQKSAIELNKLLAGLEPWQEANAHKMATKLSNVMATMSFLDEAVRQKRFNIQNAQAIKGTAQKKSASKKKKGAKVNPFALIQQPGRQYNTNQQKLSIIGEGEEVLDI